MPLIKRYTNRKLYDTNTGEYVTLEDIAGYIRSGEEVKVVDHTTGHDLTSLTLTQVLFQEEKKIGELLPLVVLTRLIRTGSDTFDNLRTRLLAAFDPDGLIDEEIRRRVDELTAKGEIPVDEADRLVEKLVGQPQRWNVTHQPSPEPLQENNEVQALSDQLAALEKELEDLKKSS